MLKVVDSVEQRMEARLLLMGFGTRPRRVGFRNAAKLHCVRYCSADCEDCVYAHNSLLEVSIFIEQFRPLAFICPRNSNRVARF